MKKIIIVIFVFLVSLALASCQGTGYKGNKDLKIKLNEVENLDFHNDIVNEYLNDELSYFGAIKFAEGIENKNENKPIIISWEAKVKEGIKASYEVFISNSEYDYCKTISTEETYVELYNPYLDTTYDYKVIGYANGAKALEVSSSFKIETKKVRTIVIDGIENCRDLGGYKTFDNRYVKQGMIYRTARFNEADESGYKELITEKGLEQFNDLKIKTEIDFREVSESCNRIDNHPYIENYYLCPTPFIQNGTIFNKEFLISVFDYLSDESNYPLFFHCAIGTDRTGLIAFLIEALLGVEETDIYYDYMLSNFANIGGGRSVTAIENYIHIINQDYDLTLKEQTVSFLVENIGIELSKIEKIQELLLK